jgi:hypothetical protein
MIEILTNCNMTVWVVCRKVGAEKEANNDVA